MPYVWQMIREAMGGLGDKTTNVAVRDWILSKYPGTNTNTIQCQIIVCTVNHSSRIHYPENKKPRSATGQYDFLYRPAKGQLEFYDPLRHGDWEIFELDDGRLSVRQKDGITVDQVTEVCPTPPTERPEGSAFAAETHFRDYLALHLDQVEEGLELFVDDSGNNGVEYPTPVGRIDILAKDKDGGFVVIELKVTRSPDSAAAQILRYKNWVSMNLAAGKRARGVIIGQHISEKVLYAIASDPDIGTKEYEISLTLRDTPPLAR